MNNAGRLGGIVRRLIAAFAIAGALVIVAGSVSGFLRDSAPAVEQSTFYPSPDRQWQATLERVDNGMGMGLGVLYYEVHVHKPGTLIARHGDRDPSAVFYVDSEGVDPPRIRWTGGRRLAIEYQIGPHEPGKRTDRIAEITIEYQRVAHPQ
jgi:hypothetical protein